MLAMDLRALHLPSKYALPLTIIASKLRSYAGIRCFAPFYARMFSGRDAGQKNRTLPLHRSPQIVLPKTGVSREPGSPC